MHLEDQHPIMMVWRAPPSREDESSRRAVLEWLRADPKSGETVERSGGLEDAKEAANDRSRDDEPNALRTGVTCVGHAYNIPRLHVEHWSAGVARVDRRVHLNNLCRLQRHRYSRFRRQGGRERWRPSSSRSP